MQTRSAADLLDLALQAPSGLGLLSVEGRLLWANAYLAELIGAEPGDQPGDRRLIDYLTPASRMFVQTRLSQELALGGRVEELALDLLDPDGSRSPIMLSAVQVAREDAAPLIQVCLSRAPVRRAYEAEAPLARQRAEAERQAAQDVISAFVRHCPVPLVMTDTNLVATGVSRAWEQTYGRSADEVLGRRMDQPRDGSSAAAGWSEIYARALSGESLSSDRPVRSTHVDIWFEWAVIPWRDAAGEVGGLLLMNFDVTALVQARDAATAADAAKSRFLANLSHELRTPLNGVLAPIELLRGRDLPPAARKDLDTVGRAGAELARSLTTLLDFSQLENGAFTAQQGETCISKLCAEVVNDCRDLIGDRPVTLHGPDWDDALTALADADALKRILVQLVANGVKFTDAGAVALDVRHDGEALVFTVSDTGCGFDASDFDALLKPFHQRDATRTRRHGGMGLGLALADRLTRAVGGALSAESVVGAGSRVTLRAPAVLQQAATPANPLASPSEDLAPGLLQVLAVDDNPANLAVLQAVLEALGADVTFAHNGLEAVEMSRAVPFDLILMDVQMPVMDGLTAIRAIRAENPAPPPVIVVSANVSRPEVVEARLAGAAEVLGKPVGAAALIRAITAVLSEPRAAEAA